MYEVQLAHERSELRVLEEARDDLRREVFRILHDEGLAVLRPFDDLRALLLDDVVRLFKEYSFTLS